MKDRKIAAVLTLIAFFLSLTACAVVPVLPDAGGKQEKVKTAKQMKIEKEEEVRSILVKSISSFSGLVIGGLIGLFTSNNVNPAASSLTGCLIGGIVGFGFGLIIYDNLNPHDEQFEDKKAKERFQEYRNMQLKE